MEKVKLDNHLIAVTRPVALEKSVILGQNYRITVLTDRLFRIETSKTGHFIDDATQSVWFRNLVTPKYTAEKSANFVKITTDAVTIIVNTKNGSSKVIFKDGKIVKTSNRGNLKGTERTLDMNPGLLSLKNGIMSKTGVAEFIDKSLILNSDGEVAPRNADTIDRYVFAYGKDFKGALKDFFRITGGVPLIPRFAFGNWWSRYRAYTQQEYIDLMQKFIDREIPITVATIDMDWHWVNINERFGTDYKGRFFQSAGWTGYSWNTDLFPDYKGFLKWLNDRNLKVTMNLHPADGIRHFEDMYDEMAREMGIDPETKTDIPFDMTNNKFINTYFKCVNRPYENDGVRFWWIDWQQGTKTALSGLDPLWSLNHYFTLDNARGQRPLILSRYAGVGSHRYPLGFSGDTIAWWPSLKVQPYFTNNASNVGYTWWSHDIGGHNFGARDDEMYLRWLQYGVFSPINRLHSSNNDLMGKEPWMYRDDICKYAEDAMRFRHKLVPYLYTMNYLTYKEGRALCEPMYYEYPDDTETYKVKNQYMFGTELMVCPIVKKRDRKTFKAGVKAYIPHGRWTDIFTGQVYTGGKTLTLYRGESSIPVLAKEGAIIPLSNDSGNTTDNPKNLEILVYRGNNEFTLYEDEGNDLSYDTRFVKTKMSVSEDDVITFNIDESVGDISLIPERRNYKILFKDLVSGDVEIIKNGEKISVETYDNSPIIALNDIKSTDKVTIIISSYKILANPSSEQVISNVLATWQKGQLFKWFLYGNLKKKVKNQNYKNAVKNSILPASIKKQIYEYID